nr:hypothetical protein [Mesorhizobium loti]
MSNHTIPSNMHLASTAERMAASAREYMNALQEYAAAKGLKPIWYNLTDDAEFNFGFVARLEVD